MSEVSFGSLGDHGLGSEERVTKDCCIVSDKPHAGNAEELVVFINFVSINFEPSGVLFVYHYQEVDKTCIILSNFHWEHFGISSTIRADKNFSVPGAAVVVEG